METIRTILWDVDGTLLDFAASEEICMNQCLKKYGVTINEEQFNWYKASTTPTGSGLRKRKSPRVGCTSADLRIFSHT